MLNLTKKGLYCLAGNFYIDPSGAVENAVITHAHADHARRGSKQYYCVQSGEGLLRVRLGKSIAVQTYHFREIFEINGVKVSFHPAGHILGSSQVRIESAGKVWVVSGDYKRESDPTCEPFQTVTCDVFITEATFGTPAHQWKKQDVAKDIQQWWKRNEAQGINSVLYAYSLGKTQRILGVLADLAHKPIYCHPAAQEINQCYREQGIRLAESRCLGEVDSTRVLRGELFIVPQGFLKNDKAAIIGSNYKTAFASGWMNAKSLHYGSYDTGFVMSDHADWNDLIQTVQQSQAKTIYVQHRGQGALVKHLKTLGLKAFPDSGLLLEKKMEKHAAEPDQMAFF